jgi:protein tyrosine phosphatase (PTP) superfamily phosphohydrolase (DUF442 family)
MTRWLNRTLRGAAVLAAGCVVLLVLALGWLGYLQWTGNVHVVQEGAVYRSNTLAPAHLADVLATEHIRTVLNLRGANTGEEWYQKETDVLNRAGVQLINVPLKSSEEPSDALLSQLVTALKEAPRPLLIHCKAVPTVPALRPRFTSCWSSASPPTWRPGSCRSGTVISHG